MWRYPRPEDREVAGLIASSLAYGNVKQIKRSVERVLAVLGRRPAQAIDSLAASQALHALAGFKHRFNDAVDAVCLLVFIREMRRSAGSIEGFFAPDPHVTDLRPALAHFVQRTLALPRDGLYGKGALPKGAGVRFFFPSPKDGSACKRLCLYLRWMVRADTVDPGGWTRVPKYAPHPVPGAGTPEPSPCRIPPTGGCKQPARRTVTTPASARVLWRNRLARSILFPPAAVVAPRKVTPCKHVSNASWPCRS